MMNKFITRLSTLALAGALSLSLAACGGGASSSAPAPSPAPSDSPSSDASAPAATVTLKIGASPAPHAEILEAVKPLLAKEGITLEIQEFTDYIMPNKALDAGELDANYFQHEPYLTDFNAKNGTKISVAGYVHFEPIAVYPGKTTTLEALADGAEIALPNDTTNEARALQLLQTLELIKLKDGVGLEATPKDIVENPKNLKFTEVEAAQVPRTLPDVDLGVVNGNYALEAGIAPTALAAEGKDSEAFTLYKNVVAVRTGDESRPEIQALVKALNSEEIRTFITDKYQGSVSAAF